MNRKKKLSKFITKRTQVYKKQEYNYIYIILDKAKRYFTTNYLYFYLIIFVSFSSIFEINNIKGSIFFNIISNVNQITLKVKGTGNTPIFYSSLSPRPSKIFLNGTEIAVDYSIFLPYSENTVILEWSSKVSSCYYMFGD